MPANHRTPYADDRLDIKRSTTPEDIHEFVYSRSVDPTEIDGIVVWNFSNHVVDEHAVRQSSLDMDQYLIPFEVRGVWGYMQSLLPPTIRDARLLLYQHEERRYQSRSNFYHRSHDEERQKMLMAIYEECKEEGLL